MRIWITRRESPEKSFVLEFTCTWSSSPTTISHMDAEVETVHRAGTPRPGALKLLYTDVFATSKHTLRQPLNRARPNMIFFFRNLMSKSVFLWIAWITKSRSIIWCKSFSIDVSSHQRVLFCAPILRCEHKSWTYSILASFTGNYLTSHALTTSVTACVNEKQATHKLPGRQT